MVNEPFHTPHHSGAVHGRTSRSCSLRNAPRHSTQACRAEANKPEHAEQKPQPRTGRPPPSRASKCRPKRRPTHPAANNHIRDTYLKLGRNVVLLARSPHLVDLTLEVWREGLVSVLLHQLRSASARLVSMCGRTLYHSSSVGVVAAVSVEGDIRRRGDIPFNKPYPTAMTGVSAHPTCPLREGRTR